MTSQCFMLTPAGRVARWLRRYLSAETGDVRLCEPHGYHQALVRIEDGPLLESATRKGCISTSPMEWPADDTRWPARCDHCGYEFHDREVRQLFYQQIYLTPDNQETTIHHGSLPGILPAPPGAMFYADWMTPAYAGPDGHCLAVMTPGGIWMIDGPSNNGPGWTRTGVPPNVTANPSIQVADRYHGWLRNGQLVEC